MSGTSRELARVRQIDVVVVETRSESHPKSQGLDAYALRRRGLARLPNVFDGRINLA
jgi:hypothetical protein